ncbi:MAG TPA: cation transporting ATPase C-terminal domain-containing protein [Terriglobales bacterium]|nr:cation transporting ATPase C-terminal domain-containing protein [Terriglobales bacterium]
MIVLVVFATAHLRGDSESNTRDLTFMTLVMSNLALILVNRSWTRIVPAKLRSPNPAVWWVVGGAVVVLATVLYVPWFQGELRRR